MQTFLQFLQKIMELFQKNFKTDFYKNIFEKFLKNFQKHFLKFKKTLFKFPEKQKCLEKL